MVNRRLGNLLTTLVAFVAMASTGRAVPVAGGLVLNLQADNINGANNNNLGLNNGDAVELWVDVIVPGGDSTPDNATAQGALDYLSPTAPTGALGTPSFVAPDLMTGSRPGVLFDRVTSTQGDALGLNTALTGLANGGSVTVFVVGDLANSGPQRLLQIGRRDGADRRIVGFRNNGFSFNGGSKLYTENLGTASAGAHIVTYSMDTAVSIANASFRFDRAAASGATTTFFSVAPPGDTLLNTTNFNQGYSVGAGQNGGANSNVIDAIEGTIYAMLVYNRVLDASETTQVENFLYDKFIAVPEASSWAALSLAAAAYGVVWQIRRRSQR